MGADDRERVAQLLDLIALQLRRECNAWVRLESPDEVVALTHAVRTVYATSAQLRADAVDVAVGDGMADAAGITLRAYALKRRQAFPDTRTTASEGR